MAVVDRRGLCIGHVGPEAADGTVYRLSLGVKVLLQRYSRNRNCAAADVEADRAPVVVFVGLGHVAPVVRPEPKRVRALAQASGWRATEQRSCFIISPYMYRLLPLAMARVLERLEHHLPRRLLCRSFWRLEAA